MRFVLFTVGTGIGVGIGLVLMLFYLNCLQICSFLIRSVNLYII